MARIPFTKMDGAGNDFIVLTTPPPEPLDPEMVSWLCHRQRGIGADGILIVGRAGKDRATMRYLNRDGSEAFCGNGARCAARFAHARGLVGHDLVLETTAGALPARVIEDGSVMVRVPGPTEPAKRMTLEGGGDGVEGWFLRVGVPHLVLTVPDAAAYPLAEVGPGLRRHPGLGPEGANVDVAEWRSPDEVVIRTYERGVERETLACGSGAVAVALCRPEGDGDVRVRVRSGEWLRVSRRGDEISLSGSARIVFEGTMEWPPSRGREGP